MKERADNEANLAANPGIANVLFITKVGSVRLDLTDSAGPLDLNWIDIQTGESQSTAKTTAGDGILINAPASAPWVAVITSSN
jgi:hypothetical protein